MSYPFVQAANDYGLRKGPFLAFVVHLAEGGGTVGFLSRPNQRGVSVHYVIQYDGRIVQMLLESHASGSINPKELRTTDGPPPYGASVAKEVLGSWWSDPNSAVITVEIEGFAATGPNLAESVSLRKLVEDVRSRHPDIGLLGHRDFQDYKACPGAHIDWAALGGHGPAGDDMAQIPITSELVQVVSVAAGVAWYDLDGATKVGTTGAPGLVGRVSPYGCAPGWRAIYATVGGHERVVLVKPSTMHDPVAPPAADCAQEVADAVAADRALAHIEY